MASKEELLQSIQPGMKLDKNFFMRIYGYELTWPGFAEIALMVLEDAGCSRTRDCYQQIVGAYEAQHEETMKNVAEWYRQQLGRNGKAVNELRETRQSFHSSQKRIFSQQRKESLLKKLRERKK